MLIDIIHPLALPSAHWPQPTWLGSHYLNSTTEGNAINPTNNRLLKLEENDAATRVADTTITRLLTLGDNNSTTSVTNPTTTCSSTIE